MSSSASSETMLHEMYKQQLLAIQQAVAEERTEDARINQLCQSALRAKYDHFVESLIQKSKIEGDLYMERALNHLESDVQHETNKLRETLEMQQAIEDATMAKMHSIISDLRKSWEDEEMSRAKRLEERLRTHYNVILEHMEAQLHMALQVHDEMDKQWVKDVENRNQQQMQLLAAFEKKCRRLYDTRLAEYIEKTDQQMTEYTTQLLQVGGAIAQERSRVESHKRRLKLACFQWKVEFQKDVQQRYHKMGVALEEKYHEEIQKMLERKARVVPSKAEGSLDDVTLTSPGTMVEGLKQLFEEANIPANIQAQHLFELLEKARSSHEMSGAYDSITQKMTSRIAIQQKLERKKFLAYKLELIKKNSDAKAGPKTAGGLLAGLSVQQKLEHHDLIKELTELQATLDDMYKKYQAYYSEPFHLAMHPSVPPPPSQQNSASPGARASPQGRSTAGKSR